MMSFDTALPLSRTVQRRVSRNTRIAFRGKAEKQLAFERRFFATLFQEKAYSARADARR